MSPLWFPSLWNRRETLYDRSPLLFVKAFATLPLASTASFFIIRLSVTEGQVLMLTIKLYIFYFTAVRSRLSWALIFHSLQKHPLILKTWVRIGSIYKYYKGSLDFKNKLTIPPYIFILLLSIFYSWINQNFNLSGRGATNCKPVVINIFGGAALCGGAENFCYKRQVLAVGA